MTTSALVSQRLNNQKLASSNFKKPVEVVRWLGAVQAQDFGAAKWALGMRMLSATDAAIEKAFNEGKILRTHVMRPTWHFVAPEDIRWLLQLTGPRVKASCGSYFRKLELDDALFKRTNKVLTKALRDGRYLTRAALQQLLNKAGVDANDPVRLSHIVLRAELDQVVCSGPRIGKQFTYALFDERAPTTKPLERDEALGKLALRYFTSHGPATLQDFVWWSGLTSKDALLSIALAGGRLENVLINAKDYWISPGVQSTEPLYSAHLIPAFDEYTVAYKDRQDFVEQQSMTKMGLLGPLVIIDGKLAGTWDRKSGTITLRPLRSLTKSDKAAITSAVARYETFLGTPMQQKYEELVKVQ
jgi:Winged helix DNA-binding domain